MRKIIHIDMDCFFVAVEIRDNPALASKPVAVGGSPDKRGVIATANYEARRFHVHSALASATALRRCPHLVIIPGNMQKYREVSSQIFDVFRQFTSHIQPLSLDEAFLDVSDCPQFHGSATLIAAEIKKRIHRQLGLTASAGVAPNKFLAKIASDWQKPDGLFVIAPADVDDFVRDLPVEKIWGVGKVTAAKMHRLGIKTCADIQELSLEELAFYFSGRAEELANLARGKDDSPVRSGRKRKSFSREHTYEKDMNGEEAFWALSKLFLDTENALQKYLRKNPGLSVKTCLVKVKFSDFQTNTVECAATEFLLEKLRPLLKKALSKSELPIRLLGCGVRFSAEDTTQPWLFDC